MQIKLIKHAASYFPFIFQKSMYHFLSHQEVCELGNLVGKVLCFAMNGSVVFGNLGVDGLTFSHLTFDSSS